MHVSNHLVRSALAAAALGASALAPAHAIPLIGLTTTNALVSFDSAAPSFSGSLMAITGLNANERILSIDVRPSTGVLYGVSSANRVFSISMTGAATAVGTLDAPLAGNGLGIDFNPAADLAGAPSLRVVSSSGQNYAFDVTTGANVAGEGAIATGSAAVAYANNDRDAATGTALYFIDSSSDVLRVAAGNFNNTPAQPITITTVGALGVDVNGVSGFDIFGANTGFAAFTNADTGKSALYTIDLTTGAATAVGEFGIGGSTAVAPPLLGLTVVSVVPEPQTYLLMFSGLAAMGLFARRRQQQQQA